MKFYIVDAFSENLFGGNPAGVVLIDDNDNFPKLEIMIKTAEELRYSETVFVKRTGKNNFHLRYFTPVAEVDLCGHATVGAFGALIEAGLVKIGDNSSIATLAGKLNVSIDADGVMMDMGGPQELQVLENKDELISLAEAMGLSVEDFSMKPQLISTGLPDIILGVKTKDVLNNINPDYKRLSDLTERYKAVGVHAFALSRECEMGIGETKITAYCRNFAPLYGIDEEAATGTANGALTYFLYKHKKIQEGQTHIFLQGESMGRPSLIKSLLRCDENSPVKIQVGGKSKILAKGEIFLS